MSTQTHPENLVEDETPNTHWDRMSERARLSYNKSWALTHLVVLMMGTQNALFWKAALALAVLDTVVTLGLLKFRLMAFPSQVRFVFTGMVFTALLVPFLNVLVFPMAAGFASFLAFDVCPMARTVGKLPWNRDLALG